MLVNHANGYIEEKNGNKYLIFDYSVDKNKEVFKKYNEVWDSIKNKIKAINDNGENDYGKDCMKTKFNSDDELPLNKPIKFHAITITIRPVFEEDGKFYPQICLDDALYEVQMLEYDTCLKDTTCKWLRIDITEGIDVNKTSASKECDICNSYHDLMQKVISFDDVAIVYVKGSAYKIHFWYMSKDYAISKMSNSNLVDKKVFFIFYFIIIIIIIIIIFLYIKMSLT